MWRQKLTLEWFKSPGQLQAQAGTEGLEAISKEIDKSGQKKEHSAMRCWILRLRLLFFLSPALGEPGTRGKWVPGAPLENMPGKALLFRVAELLSHDQQEENSSIHLRRNREQKR